MFIFGGGNFRGTNEENGIPSRAWEMVAIFSACSFGVPAMDLISGWNLSGGSKLVTSG
jgi:hypothetical protein